MVFEKYRSLALILLFLTSSLPSLAKEANGSSWKSQDNCDVPLASIKELKTSSKEECQASCEGLEECRGAVFVTGWGKCFLKGSTEKRAKIRFISGELGDKRSFEKGSYKVDHDHSGKDIERLLMNDPDQCGQACEAKADCQAFTLIEGYRVCWLKKKGGRLSPKIFQCLYR